MEEMKRVIVVGGGIVGLSIAWRLAQRGATVKVFDAAPSAGQASKAAAGMLAPGAELTAETPWSRMALDSLASYREFVFELARESGGPIDYRNCGGLELAFSAEEWSALRLRAERQRPLGIATREMNWREAGYLASGLCPEAHGAMYYPGDGIVDPVELLGCLRLLCPPEPGSVNRVEASSASARVWADGRLREADAVVLAAGAWTSRIEIRASGEPVRLPAAFPVRGQMIGYRLPKGALGPILRRGSTYLVQRRTGFLVVGASQERVGFDLEPDRNAIARLHLHAQQLLPGMLRGLTPEHWLGLRPGIESDAPFIGPVAPGLPLFAAYGHFRNGILLAPETARRMATLVMG